MQRQTIPGTDLNVSRLCLGTHTFGWTLGETESFALMDAFVEQGGNFLDTAHSYAQWAAGLEDRCVGEKTIGAWMKARKNRGAVIVGTKGGWVHFKTRKLLSSREELLMQIERSRKELGVDRLDLYWLHYDNPAYPVSHFIDFLNEQADAGRIRYFACSNWPAARIRDANAYAAAHKLRSFVANQMWWSLAKPDLSKYPDPTACGMDDATWELHCRTGLTAIPYSPQAKGFFNKLDERGVEGLDEFSTRMFASPENVAKLPRLKEVAAQADATIAQVALAWMLHQPFPTFPIVGCSRREQLVDSVKATGVKLTPEMIRKLE